MTAHFPNLQFIPDGRETEPDEESLNLVQELREIGNLQKTEDPSSEKLIALKERWQKIVREKLVRNEIVSFDNQDLTDLDLRDWICQESALWKRIFQDPN